MYSLRLLQKCEKKKNLSRKTRRKSKIPRAARNIVSGLEERNVHFAGGTCARLFAKMFNFLFCRRSVKTERVTNITKFTWMKKKKTTITRCYLNDRILSETNNFNYLSSLTRYVRLPDILVLMISLKKYYTVVSHDDNKKKNVRYIYIYICILLSFTTSCTRNLLRTNGQTDRHLHW